MTDMRRITVSFPDETIAGIERLKKTAPFRNRPYSEVIRHLVEHGLNTFYQKEAANQSGE